MSFLRYIFAAMFAASLMAAGTSASFLPAVSQKAEAQHVRWKDRIVRVAISTSLIQPSTNIKTDSDVAGAIRGSLDAWQNAADIRFQVENTDRQSVSPSGVSGDGVSVITIAQTPDNVLLFSKDPQAESAKTRVFYNAKGFITEADIVLNPSQQFSTDGTFGTFDLESTLTHEIGHLLGLRHSSVLGATMSNTAAKNGLFGYADLSPRTLSASDIAAIREIYGPAQDLETCCSAITGRLVTAGVKPAKGFRIWAEEDGTGRVAVQTETAADGSFRLGGLDAGTFLVFWQKIGDPSASQIGEIGRLKLETGDTRVLNGRAVVPRTDISLKFAGVNSQLADSAISLEAGREYTVYVGGQNLDPKNIAFEFNSPFLRVANASLISQDFGDGVSVVSFVVSINPETPAGSYSIFSIAADGSRSSLVGAIDIE